MRHPNVNNKGDELYDKDDYITNKTLVTRDSNPTRVPKTTLGHKRGGTLNDNIVKR